MYAIFYVVRDGCAWRLLPHDFPLCEWAITASGLGVSTVRGTEATLYCRSQAA